jgi:thymidine kinase
MSFVVPGRPGWIEAIIGPMYSGKSAELIRRLNLASIGKQGVIAFKPDIDNRFSSTGIVSRTGATIECVPISVSSAEETLSTIDWGLYDVVGFDEVQFFGGYLLNTCNMLAASGKRVVVAGLDTDFTGRPFETSVGLICSAEYVEKVLAVCVVCGGPASKTFRTNRDVKDRVAVGDTELYEARCRHCFEEY